MVAMVSLFPQLHRPCSPCTAQPHTSLLGQLYSGGVLTRAPLQPPFMYSAAPVPWLWLCVGELFLDILGPMGALLPQLWGGSAASPTRLSSPWAWWTLVPRHPDRVPGAPLLQPACLSSAWGLVPLEPLVLV